MSIREALKDYIESLGIKKSFISEKTGIPESAISRILNGNIRLTADAFAAICDAIGVQMDAIVELSKCQN